MQGGSTVVVGGDWGVGRRVPENFNEYRAVLGMSDFQIGLDIPTWDRYQIIDFLRSQLD
jgi:hypothetical protein